MMALDNTFLFSTQQPFGHGVGDACNDLLNPLEMESTLLTDFFEDDMYFPLVENCKRSRRLSPSCSNDAFPTGEDFEDLFESFWDSGEVSHGTKGTTDQLLQGRRSMLLGTMQMQAMSSPSPQFHEESLSSDSSPVETLTVDPPTRQAALSLSDPPSIPFKHKENSPLKGTENEKDSSSSTKRKFKLGTICPFVVVKPGGEEIEGGCVTLDDINRKLLTRPAKPVRHPVGEFACVPRASTSGFGLSGKAVVSLIRINTKGKGTVTIIRTR